MPEELQNQKVKIIIDADLMKEISGVDSVAEANFACYLHNDHAKNPYGEEVIILRDSEQIEHIKEELVHAWQYQNCVVGKLTPEMVSSMEFQWSVIEMIDLSINAEELFQSPVGIHSLASALYECINADNSFDIDNFLEINQSDWQKYYEEWSNNNNYGELNPNYNWNWEDILNLMGLSASDHTSSGGNLGGNPY